MQEIVLNLAYNNVGVYDELGKPKIALPPGWPQHDTFIDGCSVFEQTSEEIEEKYGVTFPIHWNQYEELAKLDTHIDFLNELFKLDFRNHLPPGGVKINYDTVDNYIERGEKFYYIIYNATSSHFDRPPIRLDENVVNAVKSGLAKVLMVFLTEGLSRDREHVDWLLRFGGMNELDASTFYYGHGNYNFQSVINKMRSWYGYKINFTYIPVPYFEYSSWFLKYNAVCIPGSREKYREKHDEFIQDNRNKKFDKHFNILNRRPRFHRLVFFTEVMSNPLLAKTSEISLNNERAVINSNEFVREHMKAISLSYPEYKLNYEFALKHDFMIAKELDVDLNVNRAGEYTRDFYKNTFCSVTSETLVNPDELFFSEKTFKPIYNMHPFLFLGNPYSLKKLKEFGYKTFDRWWDESYDEEQDFLIRIKKISKAMQEIATWSPEKCLQVTQEMEEILVHNFNNFLDNTRYVDFLIDLYNRHKPDEVKKNFNLT